MQVEHQSAAKLDNESKERALVGEVISTVALAGQICREFNVSVHGIDMEVEQAMDYDDHWGDLHIHLKPGFQHLDGAESEPAR